MAREFNPLDPLGIFKPQAPRFPAQEQAEIGRRSASSNLPALTDMRQELARLKPRLSEVHRTVAATAMSLSGPDHQAWERRATDLFRALSGLETAMVEVGRVEADFTTIARL